jgi:high-affinity iron transporter
VLDLPLWHSGRLLSESSAFGDVMHSFFGYSDAPTALQLLVYAGYLVIAVAAYLGLRTGFRSRRKAGPAVSGAQSPAPRDQVAV